MFTIFYIVLLPSDSARGTAAYNKMWKEGVTCDEKEDRLQCKA
jgi:hypothetical protein